MKYEINLAGRFLIDDACLKSVIGIHLLPPSSLHRAWIGATGRGGEGAHYTSTIPLKRVKVNSDQIFMKVYNS